MKTSSVVMFGFAAVLAVSAAFVARGMMAPHAVSVQAVQKAEVKAVPKVWVAVASDAVHPGEFMTAANVTWTDMPADKVPAAAFTAKSRADARSLRSVMGATVRKSLVKDTVLTEDMLLYPGSPGFIAAVLSPGMRAVSIPTSAVASNSGLVNAGDWVDVILSLNKESAESMAESEQAAGGAALKKLAAQTILEKVRVLAFNSNTESIAPAAESARTESAKQRTTTRAPRPEYRTITLEVTPEQAEKLVVSKEVGELQIALRSLRETGNKEAKRTAVTRLQDATAVVGTSRPAARTVITYQGTQAVPVTF